MPQDSLRSVVYRSFVTCDDAKGVVECRTIRKSKNDAQKMEGRGESHRTQKNLNASSTYKDESKAMVSKGISEELHNPSSFQLMEVSKGAQKLNQVIDSWSKGVTFDDHSKDIAKDLLKGALDLQDSLVMLGKLQEASQYRAKLKKKKEKSRGGRIYEMGGERTNANQFGDHNYHMGIQKPRLSADGSSRDCFEELREVIRDSLARQNLLPNSFPEEKAYCDRRTSDSALDIPSTSSSQSSMEWSCKFASSECSLSSKAPKKKPNGPNLIAKLMGLGETPSKPLESTPRKQLENDKISIQRPVFDIDMPKARKPQFVGQKVDPERKTLKEMLNTMQFKGLLKCNSVEGCKPPSHHPSAFNSRNRSIDDGPPIVVIKPMRYSCLETEEPRRQMFIREERALDTKEMLRKLRIKEELPAKSIDYREHVLNSNGMCRNLEAEEPPMKRLSQEEKVDCKEILAEPEVVVKTKKNLSSNKMRVSVPVNHKAQKREAIEKKVDKIQKVVPNRRKPVETENVKSKGASKTHDQAKVASSKLQNPEKGSSIMKSQISQQKRTTSSPISKCITPTISHCSTDGKKNLKNTSLTISHRSTDRKKNLKNEKPIREPLAAKLATETIGCKDNTKGTDTVCENESDLIRTNTASADQLLTEEGTCASAIQIEDHCNSSQYSLCDSTLQTIQHESGIKSAGETNYSISHDSTEKKFFNTKTNLKYLLLSSQLFLSHAEEIFNINANQPILLQTASSNDSGIADARFLLDCANELMDHKNVHCTRTAHPWLHTPLQNSRICISLDQLVEEVCNGIENLRSDSKIACDNLPIDSLYAVLKRDLWCKGVVSGAWDLGWSNGFTLDEIEQVVVEIEKLVLSGLIEEMFTDFLL